MPQSIGDLIDDALHGGFNPAFETPQPIASTLMATVAG
jgi:hypothetical protein